MIQSLLDHHFEHVHCYPHGVDFHLLFWVGWGEGSVLKGLLPDREGSKTLLHFAPAINLVALCACLQCSKQSRSSVFYPLPFLYRVGFTCAAAPVQLHL